MGIKKYMHGGNHHEAANYGLSSVYDKNRYSKKAQSYRRFKKGGQVLDVYSSKGEKKGKGVNGRELYNGPYKDMTLKDFFDFSNGVFKTNSEGISFANDPEYKNWRSKKRGYSADELLKYYIHTQVYIDGADVNPMDRSTWEGKNFGSPRRYITDPLSGEIIHKSNGQPFYMGHDEELHQTYLNRKNAGDPEASWYPSSQSEAFGMAKDLGLGVFFYEGKPVLTQTEEEMVEEQKKHGIYWTTNKSPQLLELMKENKEVNYSDLNRESLIYLGTDENKNEALPFLQNVVRNFNSNEEALEFVNEFGTQGLKKITVNGKNFLLEHGPNSDIAGQYYDENRKDYLDKLQKEFDNHPKTKALNKRLNDINNAKENYGIDAISGAGFEGWSPEQFFSEYDHSQYKSNFVPITKENSKHALLSYAEKFHANSTRLGYDLPARIEGPGKYGYKVNGEYVENPNVTHTESGPTGMRSVMGDIALFFALGGPRFVGSGITKTIGHWGKNSLSKSAWYGAKPLANTIFQPLKGAGDYYKRSAFNKFVGSPALPGTFGLANVNNAANATFAAMAGDQAITDFSEGNYGMGALNLGFAGLNAYNPYRKFQTNAKLFSTKNVIAPANYDLKGLKSFVNNQLPALSLKQGVNNIAGSNIFNPVSTQLGAQKYMNNMINSNKFTPNNSAYGKFILQ